MHNNQDGRRPQPQQYSTPRVEILDPEEKEKALHQVYWLNSLRFSPRKLQIYAGTVPEHVKNHRRKKNKAARIARRRNR